MIEIEIGIEIGIAIENKAAKMAKMVLEGENLGRRCPPSAWSAIPVSAMSTIAPPVAGQRHVNCWLEKTASTVTHPAQPAMQPKGAAAMINGALSRQQDERRLSIERRRFRYSNHIPERRSGRERRSTPAAFESDAATPIRLQLVSPRTR